MNAESYRDIREYIEEKEYGIGDHGLDVAIHGERRFKIRTDEEHIEGLTLGDDVYHRAVENERDGYCRKEDGDTAKCVGCLFARTRAYEKEEAYRDLASVMHHRLDIYSDGVDKDRVGHCHYENSGDDTEGRKKGDAGVVYPFARDDRGNESDEHWRRAELEGEGIPLVVCRDRPVYHVKGEGDLLECLKSDADQGVDEKYPFDGLFIGILIESAKKKANERRNDDKADVKYTVGHGDGHRQIVKLDYYLK